MTYLEIINHAMSGSVILACWWLAHEEVRAIPPGRKLAILYAILGLCLLTTALGRSLGLDREFVLPWFHAVSKATLTMILFSLAHRRFWLRRRVEEAGACE